MKRLGWVVLCLFGALAARAQVTVEVVPDQSQYLPGETLTVAVRITNRSGQTLVLGTDDDWLSFSIESIDGFVVQRLGDPPVKGEFTLESSQRGTKRVDLAPYFLLSQPGNYSVIATVKIKQWDQLVPSKPASFNIIQGAKLWDQDFGLPLTPGSSNAVPEVRRYILQQANYLKGQLRLYARVVDPVTGRSIKVQTIGPMLSFSRPEAQVDKECDLHVLYQNGPSTFSYTVLNPDGEIVQSEIYENTLSRPRLKWEGDTKIVVTGGTRRLHPDEEAAVAAAMALTNPPAISGTNSTSNPSSSTAKDAKKKKSSQP